MSSGIYKITNTKNGMFYIGSSVNIKRRWSHHKSELKNNRHHNQYLQNAYNKYGKECFVFEILMKTEDTLAEEQRILDFYFIRQQHMLYNIATVTTAPMEGKKHSEEVKILLSEKLSGSNHPHYEKPVSKEWREKISSARKKYSHAQEREMYQLYKNGMSYVDIKRKYNEKHTETIRRAIARHTRFEEFRGNVGE